MDLHHTLAAARLSLVKMATKVKNPEVDQDVGWTKMPSSSNSTAR